MFGIFLSALSILSGILATLVGLYVFLKPDSDWIRFLSRIPDDVIQDDVDLSLTKLRGIVAIIVGSLITLMSILSTIVYMG